MIMLGASYPRGVGYHVASQRIYMLPDAINGRSFAAYPVPSAKIDRLYLSSQGRANSLFGDGRLVEASAGGEPPDHFTFDPKNPVPLNYLTPGGLYAVDRRVLERRDDILMYTGETLNAAGEVIGRVSVELFAASDALTDTDFTASIIDVSRWPCSGVGGKSGGHHSGALSQRFCKD